MKIVLIGLSNKKEMEPFDSSTPSGKIIDKIIDRVDGEFYKLNLVPYAPLDKNGKLRYPNLSEIKMEIPNLKKRINEIHPDLIIGFGSIVGKELKKIKEFDNKLIIEKHPSYIYVYQRKELKQYINHIVLKINSFKEE